MGVRGAVEGRREREREREREGERERGRGGKKEEGGKEDLSRFV